MSFKSILKDYEVPVLAGLRSTFPVCELTDVEIIEYTLFKSCLGLDFRKDLMNDLVDHSTVLEYDDEKTYAVDEKASFNQYVYQATVITTGNRPDNILYWKDGLKFDQDLYNELWCNYLGKYLAYNVVKHTAAGSSIYLGPQGAVRRSGENFTPASTTEINLLMKNIDAKITMSLEVMVDWMKSKKEDEDDPTTVFDNYLGFLNGCEGKNGCVKSRATKHRWRVA